MSSPVSSGSPSPLGTPPAAPRRVLPQTDGFPGAMPAFILPHQQDAESLAMPAAPASWADEASGSHRMQGAVASRVNQACANCRRRKVRCDGMQPQCANCIARGIECTYPIQKKRGRPPKAQPHQPADPAADQPAAEPGSYP
ncbi:hypothetical protein LPJ61_005113, partial [Coemansia biformis]